MSHAPRPLPSLALCFGLACATALPAAGCSVNASWQTGTTTSRGKTQEPRPAESASKPKRSRPVNTDAVDRQRRRRDEEARIDREARERVQQAERDAAERERQADEEAERERKQAADEAEQRRKDAEAAASADKAQKSRKRAPAPGRFDMGTQGATGDAKDDIYERRKTEIDQSAGEKKAQIRKQLEQNKSDILVAAERKRTEVQESIKDTPEKAP
jgi:hypothetical protein